jgi:hypothetical protein
MRPTPKEKQAIEALQELAKTWPKTLQIGCNDRNGLCQVWKRVGAHEHKVVADVAILNIDMD